MVLRKMNLIVAVASNGGIGKNNDLPWKLTKEFRYFVNTTRRLEDASKKNAVVLGRKTWESIPPTMRPMKGKINVIVTSQKDFVAEGKDVYVVHSLQEAQELLSTPPLADTVETIWQVGGASLYQEAIEKKLVDKLYLTKIRKEYDADVFFPKYNEEDFVEISDPHVPEGVLEEDGVEWTHHVLQMK
ncbi:putative dihydrofolate reductase [Pollicipes pollicipes]|uniref:putative dihydrofolate reductase n=1 Tax=Pollicipes pollicipes TaxID=41117 RepID=UPI00188581B9|nr:putative dihydrofolate reductase [Pollicipes pollicipes]XP_037082968.1 putative dihydrofolate reductase [Pollicipes pollicipes]